MRRRYQVAMQDEVAAAVERLTGQRAETVLSDHDPEADVAFEMVRLAPAPVATPEAAERR